MLNEQKIQIVLDVVNRATGKTREVITSMETLENGIQRVRKATFEYGNRATKANKIVEQYKNGFISLEDAQKKLRTTSGKLVSTSTQMTKGMQRFKMELLSTMFFGMSIQRVFNGLIKTSLEWVGIQELLNTTLGIVFLPIAEDLLDILLPIMEWFWDLPDGVKEAIGAFALLGSAIGGILTTIGIVGLGLPGIAQTFGLDFGGGIIKGISSKLAGFNIGKYLKGGAVALSVYLAVQDLLEGDVTAAIGMGTLAVGIYTGNPYLIGVGVALKLIGEPDFLAKFIVFLLKLVDNAIYFGQQIGDAIWAGITGKEFNWEFGQSFFKELDNELAKTTFKSGLLSGLNIPQATGGGFIPTLENSKNFSLPSGNISQEITYNITGVSSPDDIKRMLEENNRTLTSEIRRSI